jgi:cytochrome bd-type quinol oxidase subunit 1
MGAAHRFFGTLFLLNFALGIVAGIVQEFQFGMNWPGYSAFVTANARMQHPVGYRIVGHGAELTDFWAVLRNSTLPAEFTHTVLAAFVTGAMLVLGVSAWQMLRGRQAGAFVHLDAATADIVLKAVLEDAADRSLLWVTHQPEELACFDMCVRLPACG